MDTDSRGKRLVRLSRSLVKNLDMKIVIQHDPNEIAI